MNSMKSRLAGCKEPKQVSRSSEEMNGFAKGFLFSLATEVEENNEIKDKAKA